MPAKRVLRWAVRQLRDGTGVKAGSALRGLADSLPDGDAAREPLLARAAALEQYGYQHPFAATWRWAPFVLHGAPMSVSDDRAKLEAA